MKKILLLISLFLSSLSNAQEVYYNDVDLSAEGLSLKDKLATKTINEHTNLLSYTPGVWEALKVTDLNPTNNSEVLLVYGYAASGTAARSRNINSNGGNTGDWNREHTYPKSLGNPNLGSTGPGADAHHLRPSDVGYNGNRGNLKFVDGSGNSGSVSGGWFPGDEWKGDIARMMMYMYIRYGNQCLPSVVGVGSSNSTPDAMIDLFLKWNAEDPVSDFERQRNTYHDSNQTYAQGNRNPFIDNAYLATRIWGGDAAIDSWGIYTSTDNEAPTVPANVSVNNINFNSFDISWTASTDNIAVTSYDVYVDGNLSGNTANTNFSLSNLNSSTTYSITVLAKDLVGNKSAQSAAASGTTLTDASAPTVPTNVTISNETGTSFKVSWSASTDNVSVSSYDVYIDGSLHGSAANTNYNVSSLTASTSYSVRVLAKDQANNLSAQSTAVTATTTDGSNNAVDLFFSEYVEGNSFNKAIEIANITGNTADLTPYSVARQSGGNWETALNLTGSIAPNDVYVIINSDANIQKLIDEADLGIANTTPMTFNGDDRVGLFKDGVLVDIIGDLDGTDNFAANITLRRSNDITGPNIVYSEQGEWIAFDQNTVDDIGSHNGSTASVADNLLSDIKIYPNPANGNIIYIKTTNNTDVNIYNVLGKMVKSIEITAQKNNIDISNLSKGIYIVKMTVDNISMTKKLIKN
ncbi:MAG: endonuclease [Polaribacter sp.]|uniref:endonuclease n=1 Tax=Polaribacter sp. TaxID=1920175 RepID=UPI002610BF71|nr:endonuclease [Polaribacter sp.]MBT3741789.1 T9SS type A sorting domain-containing protein [Polaribacter sp.]MDG1195093.1 endonuclease [Polaribacter sp.]MDG1403139.1 endonuclease [Polaribacter sp.]